jgi:hypothetical protein
MLGNHWRQVSFPLFYFLRNSLRKEVACHSNRGFQSNEIGLRHPHIKEQERLLFLKMRLTSILWESHSTKVI